MPEGVLPTILGAGGIGYGSPTMHAVESRSRNCQRYRLVLDHTAYTVCTNNLVNLPECSAEICSPGQTRKTHETTVSAAQK